MNHRVRGTLLILAAILLSACATHPAHQAPVNILSTQSIPAADPALDHYIAWVPLQQAQTATVAEAITHISLRGAREQASHDICKGVMIRQGKIIEKHGPVVAEMPATMGGRPAWYYRISQQPGLYGCRNRRTTHLYQAIQARLPAWISILTAQPDSSRTVGLAPRNW